MAMGCQTLIPNTNGTKHWMPQGKSLFFLSPRLATEIDLNVILNCILLVFNTFLDSENKNTNSWDAIDLFLSPNVHCQKQIERNQIYWIEMFLCGFLATCIGSSIARMWWVRAIYWNWNNNVCTEKGGLELKCGLKFHSKHTNMYRLWLLLWLCYIAHL